MPYLILGIAVIVGLFLIVQGIARADPKTLARVIKWTAVVVLVFVVFMLTLHGRIGLLLPILAVLVPMVVRWRSLARMAQNWGGPSPGQSSGIETRYLRMTLDHDTGLLDGTVLDGPHRGRFLSELSLEQLVDLLRELRLYDRESVPVLEAFLDRSHGPDWRGGGPSGAGAGDGGGNRAGGGGWAGATNGMTMAEAYEVLGLSPGASSDDIKEAHRRMMMKHHPDHGGSTVQAARINQAKDILLGG